MEAPAQSGDQGNGLKRCCRCGESKPLSSFWKGQKRCIVCQRAAMRESAERREPDRVPPEKRCPRCEGTKAESQFYRNRTTADGLSAYCRLCTAEYVQQAHERDPSRRRGYNLKRYGIDSVEYDRLRQSQNGRCAICGTPDPSLNLDHCHRTERVRGLLCNQCNNGIGCFDDNAELLGMAIAYLRWWSQPEGGQVYPPPDQSLRDGARGTCDRTGRYVSLCCGAEADATKGRPFPYCQACGSPTVWKFLRKKDSTRRGPRPGFRDAPNAP